MGKLRYSFLRVSNDPQALENEIRRYRALVAVNTDPSVAPILQRLIAEAEARLAVTASAHDAARARLEP